MSSYLFKLRKYCDGLFYGRQIFEAYGMDAILERFDADNVLEKNKINYGQRNLRDHEYDRLLNLARMEYVKTTGHGRWVLLGKGVALKLNGGMKVKVKQELIHILAIRISFVSLLIAVVAVTISLITYFD